MVQRRIALTVYQPAKPGVQSFAILAAFEAASRAVVISVYPVLMYRSLGDAKTVSEFYFLIGLGSLVIALFTPWLNRLVPRRWLFTAGSTVMVSGGLVGLLGGLHLVPLAVFLNAAALVVLTICFNAYVMDYIDRHSMGRNETMRLLYSGAAWSIGPWLGVWLMDHEPSLPFMASIFFSLCQLAFFWFLRMGNGKAITRAKRPAANPLAYLARFFRQPSLVSGWTFAVIRSVGWAIYIIYVPIFAVEAGLGDQLGGMTLSISNAFLFLSPFMLRFLHKTSVRTTITLAFLASAALFLLAYALSSFPMLAIGSMLAGTMFLVMLDVSGGLPFLMTVKPSERTEMAAVYSTFRDVSAVISPAIARTVLVFAPVAGVFAAGGAALLACAFVARRIHPRLGKKRLS